jgi:hypothetical protein
VTGREPSTLKEDGEMPQTGLAASREDRAATDERPHAVTEERHGEADRYRAAGAALSPGGGDGAGVPGRRTVTIRGQGAERGSRRYADASRRRPERRHEREGFRPDRAALWAFLLGVTLILVAVSTAHASVL